MYEWVDGDLVWREPADENAHIEIAVRDAADGRFVPGADVVVTVLAAVEFTGVRVETGQD